MRRITTGLQGGPILGSLAAEQNNLKTLESNTDIVLDPDGAGEVKLNSHAQVNSGNALRFADDNNSNYIGLTAPSNVNENLTYTLPGSDGANGHVLVTNGGGSLSFTDISFETTDQTTDTSTYYPLLAGTAPASGSFTSVNTSSSRMTFTPSSGTLAVTRLTVSTAANIVMDNGSINGVPIGASTATTGAFTTLTCSSLTETSSIAYKENVNPINNALDAVTKLSGVVYDRKDGSSVNEAGLIAEEVEKVLPNIVSYKDGKAEGVQYTKLTAYLIEAVKSLTQEVKELKEGR